MCCLVAIYFISDFIGIFRNMVRCFMRPVLRMAQMSRKLFETWQGKNCIFVLQEKSDSISENVTPFLYFWT